MSCDQCWEVFSNRKKVARLTKENAEMKKAVDAALVEIESTQDLIGDYIERIDSILTSVKKTSGAID